MLNRRYAEWTAVWDWFRLTNTKEVVPRADWDALYNLLNDIWQEERSHASPEELAAHAGAMSKFKQ
jgi:hypothetical protein